MSLKNKILYTLAKNIIKRNQRYANLHKGESCYIIGNGASIKYCDLKNFSDKVAIGCNNLFVHQNFRDLNVKYYYTGHPFLYYPYWKNQYANKYTKNTLGALYKEKINLYRDISYFASVSNYFGINGSNINFVHHFDKPFGGYDGSRLDKEFTPMACALSGMLGLAIYMGFKDITLVGCDYAFFPQLQGHFFDYGKFPDTFHETPFNKEFLLDAMQSANVRVITPNDEYRGHILPHIGYEKFTGEKPLYHENDEIVSNSDLLTLDRSGMLYKIFSE